MKKSWILMVGLLSTGCGFGTNGTSENGRLHEPDVYDNPTVASDVKNLKDEDPETRFEAAQNLAEMGSEASQAVPALANDLVTDSDWRVRDMCALALGRIGPDASPAIPYLIEAMNDSNFSVRKAAIHAMPSINGRRPPPPPPPES